VGERQIGKTTSGTHLPYLKGAYAMALLEKQYSGLGTAVTVIVRGRSIEAEVTSLPFYSEA
jgi:aminomethyltransferase